MKKLWAPWRIEYIRSEKDDGGIFCDKPEKDDDREMLILHRGGNAFVMMNLYPYNNGHVMISPLHHISDFDELPVETQTEIMNLTTTLMRFMRKEMNAEGKSVSIPRFSLGGKKS